MKKVIFGVAAMLLTSAGVFPANAQNNAQDVRQLRSKDLVDLDSGKAYILYEIVEGKFDIFFLRSLTEDELKQFNENRKEALAEARQKRRERRDGAPGVSDEELIPDASFAFVDRDIRNLVRMDSGRVYEKDGKRRTYIVEVPVGEYTVFGAGIDGMTSGTCMCMGSVAFDADAGKITDLGAILVALEDGETEIEELKQFVAPEYIQRKALPYGMTVRLPADGDSVPEVLRGLDVDAAKFRPVDRLPNSLGMLINRMAPIDGILSYNGDKISVETGGAAVQSTEKLTNPSTKTEVAEEEKDVIEAASIDVE